MLSLLLCAVGIICLSGLILSVFILVCMLIYKFVYLLERLLHI